MYAYVHYIAILLLKKRTKVLLFCNMTKY